MRLNMIDYIGVSGSKQDGWTVRDSRLSKKMLCCRSTSHRDIISALHGWGVLPKPNGYRVVKEFGQYTVFEDLTDKPVCALFSTGDM